MVGSIACTLRRATEMNQCRRCREHQQALRTDDGERCRRRRRKPRMRISRKVEYEQSLEQGIERLEYRGEPRTRDEMSREVIQDHIKKEDLMYFPTQHADADQHHGRHRDATAQQYSPLPVQGKTRPERSADNI
jgi:hypothetical protein